MELTSNDVAEIFDVALSTVSVWSRTGRLVGNLPRNARKSGRRFKLSAVREFARTADDASYSERQLEKWLKEHHPDNTDRSMELIAQVC